MPGADRLKPLEQLDPVILVRLTAIHRGADAGHMDVPIPAISLAMSALPFRAAAFDRAPAIDHHFLKLFEAHRRHRHLAAHHLWRLLRLTILNV